VTEPRSDSVGSASVDIYGDLSKLDAALEAAEARLQAFVEREWKVKIGATGPAKSDVANTQSETPVTANAKDVGTAGKPVEMRVDTAGIIRQIQTALDAHPFTIKIAGIETGKITGALPASEEGAATRSAAPVPSAVTQALQVKGLPDAINALYRAVKEQGGLQTKRDISVEPGREVEKVVDLMDTFGDNLNDWVKITTFKTKSGGTTDRITGGSIFSAMRDAGFEESAAKSVASLAAQVRTLSSGRALATNIKENRPALDAAFGTSPSVVQQVVKAAATEAATAAVKEVVPPAARKTERPISAPAPGSMPGTALAGYSWDELMGSLQGRLGASGTVRPRRGRVPAGNMVSGRTGPNRMVGQPGDTTPFDVDPTTGEFLSAKEIQERSRGQIPTPFSPTGRFSYAGILGLASQGFFSNTAEVVDKRHRGTGRYIRYDPSEENPEIQLRLLKGKVARVGDDQVKAVKPSEMARRMLNDPSNPAGIPAEDLDENKGGFAERVISKLVPVQATAFTNRLQAVKQAAELGKRSGTLTPGKSLEQLVRLDLAYIEAFEELQALERGIPNQAVPTGRKPRSNVQATRVLDATSGGGVGSFAEELSNVVRRPPPASTRELEKRQQQTRERMSRLVEQGADPNAPWAVNLSNKQRAEALRTRRASRAEVDASLRQGVADNVGIPDWEVAERARKRREKDMGYDASVVPQNKIQTLIENLVSGRTKVPEKGERTLTEKDIASIKGTPAQQQAGLTGAALRQVGDAPLSDKQYVAQEIIKILDEFRESIGDTKTTGLRPPKGYEDLGTVISAAFARISEPRPGGAAMPGQGFAQEVSYSERDRRLAEGTAHRRDKVPVTAMTGVELELAKREGQAVGVANIDEEIAGLKRQAAAAAAKSAGIKLPRTGNSAGLELYNERIGEIQGTGATGTLGKAQASYAARIGPRGVVGRRIAALDAGRVDIKGPRERARGILGDAEQMIREISGQTYLGNRLQYSEGGRRVAPGPEFYDRPNMTGSELRERLSAKYGASSGREAVVARTARELVEAGRAPGFTRYDAAYRATKSPTGAHAVDDLKAIEGLTGDKTREVTAKTAYVAGGVKPSLLSAWPGGGGNREISGVVHVIVDNTPLPITWRGGVPGGDGGGGGGSGTDEENGAGGTKAKRYRRKNLRDQGIGTEANQNTIYTYDPKVYEEAERTSEAKAARRREEIFQRRDTIERKAIERREREANGTGGATSQTALRRQLGLPAVATRTADDFAELDKSDQERARLAAEGRRAERGVPKRGFTASTTDIFSNLGGFLDNQVASIARFQRESGQLATLRGGQTTAQVSLRDAEEVRRRAGESLASARARGGTPTEIARAQRLFDAAEEGVSRVTGELEKYNVAVEEQSKIVSRARKDLPGPLARAGAFGIGAGAAVGAVAVGTIVAQLAGQLLTVVGDAVGPAVERATGFAGTTGRITGNAADVIRQRGGDQNALAGLFAGTGISSQAASQISPLIANRASVEAGNKALKEQVDLLHTFENLSKDQRPGGFDKGLFSTTGGQFGTDLFGVPSTAEILDKELEGVHPGGPGGKVNVASRQIADLKAQREQVVAQQNEIRNAPAADFPFGKELGLMSTQHSIDIFDEQIHGLEGNLKTLNAKAAEGGQRLDFFNDAAQKGGSSLKLVSDAAEAEKSAKLAESVGLKDLAAQFRESGVGVKGAQTGFDIQSLLAAINRGAQTPDVRLLLEDNARQRQAQIGLEDQQRKLTIEKLIPQTTALSQAGSPLPPAKSGINTTGLSPSERKSLNADLRETQSIQNQITAETAAGVQAAKDFVAETFKYDPSVGQDFAASIDRVIAIGKEISHIQIGVQTQQAAYAAHQYAYQIEVANRNLRDAKGLTGQITEAGKDNLGVLERQQFFLQRRAQLLQFELSQRQINFQVALAGFQAPGQTSEERAARIEEAKAEAGFAQKQLDIQRKLFGLQGRSFQITASRNVRDLVKQIGLLEEGRQVVLSTAAAEKKIRALTLLQEKENKKVQAFYQAAVARTQDVMTEEAKLVAATGKNIREIASDVLDAFAHSYRTMTDIISGGLGHPDDLGSNRRGYPAPQNAVGAFGLTSGTTDIGYAGEAGKEAVAIIRNPKRLIGSFGSPEGGGGDINVYVSGNNVSSEEDLQKLTSRIVTAVERAQSRKVSLLGMPRP
jgi:hypothetical protein